MNNKIVSTKDKVNNQKKSTTSILPVDKKGNLVQGSFKTNAGELRVKKIQPATKYDVINVARSMNDDFAPQLKELFTPEQEACVEAMNSGLYISYRPIDPPYNTQDCIRVSSKGRCFCSHILNEHDNFTGKEPVLKCLQSGCLCKSFAWVPSRPEESGEFWLRKRRDFIPELYRSKCRCKHTHEEHKAYPPPHRCKVSGCGCSMFNSAFVCAACDQHWHRHQTVFETENERKSAGRPIGRDWLPFAELPGLRDMAITGDNNPNIQSLQDALPSHLQPQSEFDQNKNDSISKFRPLYD